MTQPQTQLISNAPYLRSQRNFPNDNPQGLSVEVDKAYIDIAQRVNARTIGIFPANAPAVNGEAWYLNGQTTKLQGLRQVYGFSSFSSPLSIPHGINFSAIVAISKIYGTAYDGTYWYPLPYVDVVDATNQINITISSTNIIITAGGGSPPSITNGIVVLEWLSQP